MSADRKPPDAGSTDEPAAKVIALQTKQESGQVVVMVSDDFRSLHLMLDEIRWCAERLLEKGTNPGLRVICERVAVIKDVLDSMPKVR